MKWGKVGKTKVRERKKLAKGKGAGKTRGEKKTSTRKDGRDQANIASR